MNKKTTIGRHEGLKIPWPVMAVRVQVPLAALLKYNSVYLKIKSIMRVYSI